MTTDLIFFVLEFVFMCECRKHSYLQNFHEFRGTEFKKKKGTKFFFLYSSCAPKQIIYFSWHNINKHIERSVCDDDSHSYPTLLTRFLVLYHRDLVKEM